MPLYMDVHNTIPAAADKAALEEAHAADMRVQAKYSARYINYWFDEERRKVFCLVEAPDIDSANAVHREAHGLVADEIYQVVQG